MKRLLFAVLFLFAAALQAQAFPVAGKPVRIVVPYPPGGQTDMQARAIAPKLAPLLGVPVVVDNKPGAATIIGAMEVVKAPPDGHTLLYTISTTVSQNPHLFTKLPYDPWKDLTPVMFAAKAIVVLVAPPGAPYNTVAEMVEHAKRHPGKLNFASFSAGSSSHLAGEMLKQQTGIDIVHVPFKGAADANMALFGGHVQLYFDGPMTAIQNAAAGKVKLLAYGDTQRLGVLPNLPTLAESGITGMDLNGGMQFFAPGGTPREVAARVNAALATVLKDPGIARLFADGGCEITASSPEEHARLAREWSDRWGGVIRRLGLKLD